MLLLEVQLVRAQEDWVRRHQGYITEVREAAARSGPSKLKCVVEVATEQC